MMQKTKIILWFDGIDTISNISINGIPTGTTDNMFRRYIFDITNKIHRGPDTTSNLLQINFTSAAFYADQKKEEAGYEIPYTDTPWQVRYFSFFIFDIILFLISYLIVIIYQLKFK